MKLVVTAKSQPPYLLERKAVPIVQEAGWVRGPGWTGAENLTLPTGIGYPDPPVRNLSLYTD